MVNSVLSLVERIVICAAVDSKLSFVLSALQTTLALILQEHIGHRSRATSSENTYTPQLLKFMFLLVNLVAGYGL
jgi:hypothetical protein